MIVMHVKKCDTIGKVMQQSLVSVSSSSKTKLHSEYKVSGYIKCDTGFLGVSLAGDYNYLQIKYSKS